MPTINSAAKRLKLRVRAEPYWDILETGCKLGYRKRSESTGTWVAMWTSSEMQESGKGRKAPLRKRTLQKKVGHFPGLDHKEAKALAEQWFEQCRGGVVRSGTVEDACKQYVADQRNVKGARSADFVDKQFKQLIYGRSFGLTKMDELTTRTIELWRDGLVEVGRRKNSANRLLRSLKAAMNFAFQRGMCLTDSAWRRVKPFKGPDAADKGRTVYLSVAQRQALLAECSEDTANFLRALLHTAARPSSNSELPVARVQDFDELQRSLTLRTYKGDGTERRREVPLSNAAVAFFREMKKGKLPTAYLLTCQGLPWERHQWADDIRAAVDAANAKISEPGDRLPEDTVAYTMRHCAITDLLKAGISVSQVAKIAGTSTAMIEKYYFKFIATDVEDKLAHVRAF